MDGYEGNVYGSTDVVCCTNIRKRHLILYNTCAPKQILQELANQMTSQGNLMQRRSNASDSRGAGIILKESIVSSYSRLRKGKREKEKNQKQVTIHWQG